ncbi:MAG: DUF4838 domain-containing protein [Clostridia bacterium]|nr:DUF4838 domain-containing protein [Clostridia bacterium]
MKKFLVYLLLATLLLLSVSCTIPQGDDQTTTSKGDDQTTTPQGGDSTTAPQDGHPDPEESVLKSADVIAIGENESVLYAREELIEYLQAKGVQIAEGAFPITLSLDESLGSESFVINASLEGNDVGMTIKGGDGRGVLYGVYEFLEEYAGVRYFTATLETISDDDIVLKDGELLSYTPYFETRRLTWYCVAKNADLCTKWGVNACSADLSGVYGGQMNYGSLWVHTIGKLTETGGAADVNPCLTDEKNLLTAIKNVRAALEADPTITIASISQNDNQKYCTCENCAAIIAEEGSPSGLMLRFVNAIAENLEADYPDLIIDTLAYQYTQAAPKVTVPRDNVCVRLCADNNCYVHPKGECTFAYNVKFKQNIEDWSKICDRLYIWDYTTNYRFYVTPFANFGSLRENMQFYAEHNVKGMFPQGNSQSESGEFGELRAYLLAQLMWNPYMTEEEYYGHMDEFLEAYYGAGWSYIRAYIDKLQELAWDSCSKTSVTETPFTVITKLEYLENEEYFDFLWDNAEANAGDRAEYVHRSRFQWRYIQLLLHPDEIACLLFTDELTSYNIRYAENNTYNVSVDKRFPDLYASTSANYTPGTATKELEIVSTAGVKQYFYDGLPIKYGTLSAITIAAKNNDKSLSSGVQYEIDNGIFSLYTDPAQADSKLVYKVTVAEAGTYNLCIGMKMDDDGHYWNSISVNGSAPIEMDFKMESTAVAESMRDANESAYMTGYQLELQAGENIIEISIAESQSSNTAHKTMHLRYLYLIKAEATAPDPDADLTKLVLNSTTGVEQTFYNGLPSAYTSLGVLKITCNNYDTSLSTGVMKATYNDITHCYTDPTNANAKLVYKITVAEAGTYNLCVEMRMKDDKHRWNSISVNGSAPIEMDFQMESTAVAESMRDANESAYMTGYQLELKAGENIIEISIAESQSSNTAHKTMHLRYLYLKKS